MAQLKPKQKAPKFKAYNQLGELVTLDDFKGKKLALYFYPKDSTPTCTVEACNLRDNYKMLQKKGYHILGVSPDNAKSHLKFIAKNSLPFNLLCDEDLTIAKQYGVWGHKVLFGKAYMGIIRTTFIIDENGIIERIIDQVTSKTHSSQIINIEDKPSNKNHKQ